MKMFKVCSECIYDLQRVRRQSENGWKQNLGASTIPWINCKNKPRCFDQPERSKREDLKCNNCKIPRVFNCCWSNDGINWQHKNDESCDEYNFKMRCSEHCGNTVRDK